MKKAISLLLALMLCLSLAAPALAADETSGKCGENVTWSYNDGTLTISGTGDMEDYYDADANALSMTPWGDYLRQIETLNIGDGVTRIGGGAFASCTNLTSVTIPNSVTTIGGDAFGFCGKLTSVTIPSSVTAIEAYAFYNCNGLTGVTIPDSVTAIGDAAFYNCNGLTGVTIPNSVTTIGFAAFYNCNGLTGVTIPNSVTTIGIGAFASCTSLAGIEVASGNPAYSSADGVLFNADQTRLHTYPAGKSDASYNIPASVTSIEENAFYDCRSLTSVTIPDSVTTIGNDAFYNCNGLTEVTISNSVTTIGDSAFTYSKFANVTIPDSVTAIGEYAFAYNTALTSVTIPGGVTTIGDGAFSMCLGLTSVTILDGVTTIERGAFGYCSELTSVTIPPSVTTIGTQAFASTSLTDVYYGGNESQWQQIEISDEMDGALPLYNATMHYNSAGPAPSASESIPVFVNGAAVVWTDAEPFIDENDRTMVPLRAVADAMGLEVNWDENTREASFTGSGKTIIFPIGSSTARTSEGGTVKMDTAAVIVNDRTYAPIRYLAEYFGYTVDWDAVTRTVLITG